ncbi:glycerol-3-phosphate 1-O-acyltransferase PlsY [Ruminococcaceae bacterium OttesenSCG-928-D13]|nr:glycerol-3-phosphate 1-O-acyltransferase PlsY [Ruminococcaceae bacterium OttesenSCG-928-D13]
MVSGLFILALVLAAVEGYLIGSVSFGVLVSKALYGKDVRTLGSHGAGMTNVLRNFGKKGAAITMLGDTAKGVATVLLGRWLILLLAPGTDTLYGAYVAAVFTLLGHMFPLYFGFKGGKGVATSLGIIVTLQPVLAIALLALFLVVFAISKMVSLGSIIAIAFYPVTTLLWCLFVSHQDVVFSTVCAVLFAVLVIYMHRGNIQRIRNGTEYKFGQKKKSGDAAPDSKEE